MASVTIKQTRRSIKVDSPLGEDTLIPVHFDAEEEVSRLFTYRLELLSNLTIAPEDILGKGMTVRLAKPAGDERIFHGRVVRFVAGQLGAYGYRTYYAELGPWAWWLTRTCDLRIFEDEKVPDIIEKIFRDSGFSDFDLSQVDKGKHPKREYCVQYRESDFNFVSRLMEEEGMHYFFKHEAGKHTMMLADKTSAYYDVVDKEAEFNAAHHQRDCVTIWQRSFLYRSGKWAQRDYNFKTPSDKLNTNKNTLLSIPQASKYEQYDYPGLYFNKGDGDNVTTWRMEQEETGYEIVEGASDYRSFSPGGKFKMKKHACKDEEGKTWVITSVRHSATDRSHFAGEGGPPPSYSNTFTCIPDSRIFRPERLTPKPVVYGPHVAFVTGPAGEEIHTDEYGRIKVQFPWEREGKTSCWARVTQTWAGKKWGAQFIPRIGMEVIVEFLEGDPDRPIVTGCVYNADYMPPYALTANKTQSGWKSRTSTGGGESDFNELRFEDKNGQEEIYFHAQKDFNRVVENNDSLKVGFDKKMPGKQDIEIYGNRTTTIEQGNDDLTLKMGSKTTKVNLGSISYEAMQKIELKVGASKITIDMTGIKLEAPMITISGTAMTTVKAPMTTVQGNAMMMVQGGMTTVTGTPCVVSGPPLMLG
jgi:type VI secretion system secreted protein VgrG